MKLLPFPIPQKTSESYQSIFYWLLSTFRQVNVMLTIYLFSTLHPFSHFSGNFLSPPLSYMIIMLDFFLKDEECRQVCKSRKVPFLHYVSTNREKIGIFLIFSPTSAHVMYKRSPRISELEELKPTFNGPLEYLEACKKRPQKLVIRVGHLKTAPPTWDNDKFSE